MIRSNATMSGFVNPIYVSSKRIPNEQEKQTKKAAYKEQRVCQGLAADLPFRSVFPIYKFWKNGQPMPSWNAKYAREGLPAEDETAYLTQPYVQTLLQFLPERAHVLDAGCGAGGLMRFLHRRGFHVTGVDASSTAVETARTVVPGAATALATFEQLPFPASSFDAYLAIGSWEYAADGPLRATEEAARVVKSGGLVCVEVPYANIVRRLLYLPLKRFEYAWKRDAGETPTLAHYVFTIRGVRGALQRAGLTVHPRRAT